MAKQTESSTESFLVPVETHGTALSVKELLEEDATEFASAAKSKNTRRAYEADLRDFADFCASLGEVPFPATPQTVARYFAHLAKTPTALRPRGASVATIRRHAVSIAQMHKSAGGVNLPGVSPPPNPVADPHVREILTGIANTKGSRQRKKQALKSEGLRQAIRTIDQGTLPGIRDRAMLLLTFMTACRRSEIAALNVEDLRFDERGIVVTLRKSKTDQAGAGREIPVPFVRDLELCAARAVREWMEAAKLPEAGPLFRAFRYSGSSAQRQLIMLDNAISPQCIALLVKRVTESADIRGDFSAHSLRAGYITEAASTKGVSEVNIQGMSGHRSVTILRGYVRKANIFQECPTTAMFG